jgi:hypothetical protein
MRGTSRGAREVKRRKAKQVKRESESLQGTREAIVSKKSTLLYSGSQALCLSLSSSYFYARSVRNWQAGTLEIAEVGL